MPLTRHLLDFNVPILPSTESDQRNPDKQKLRETIMALYAQGMSYRNIAQAVGIHWTRVGQIMRKERDHGETG